MNREEEEGEREAMTQRRGKDEEEARVTGGGLLDLRKITLGHRLSLTVMLPGDTLSKERKEENTERNVGPRVYLLNAPPPLSGANYSRERGN